MQVQAGNGGDGRKAKAKGCEGWANEASGPG